MKMLGKSRGIAFALSLCIAGVVAAPPASAQLNPNQGAQPTPTTPPAKPAAPAAQPAQPGQPAAPTAKPADPKAALASGEKKFKAGDYSGALADFEASNTAKASPEAQRYIALCLDNLKRYPEAVAAFEKLIADNPPKMKSEVDEAKKRVEAIKAMPGTVSIQTTPAGASIVIDTSQTPYEKTTPVEIDLPPGKHTILIGAEGYENTSKEIDVQYGSKQDLRVELVKREPAPAPAPPPVVAEQTPAQPAPPPPPPEPRSKVPAYVTGAVAIVALGVGTGFGLKALSQSNDFKDNPTTKLADDGENNALVADMMFGIAITFGVTSAVLFLSSDAPATAKAAAPKAAAKAPAKRGVSVTPAPYVTSHGGGAGALFRF
jgi:hypothetical protein